MSKIIELNRVILVLELNFRSLEGEYEAVIGNRLIMKYDLDFIRLSCYCCFDWLNCRSQWLSSKTT